MASYQRALTLVRQLDQPEREALIHYNLGLLVQGQGRFDEALNHLYRAADIVTESSTSRTAASPPGSPTRSMPSAARRLRTPSGAARTGTMTARPPAVAGQIPPARRRALR
jgi:hypothetical protein